MAGQSGLDLFFNVLLACSKLQDGGERRQSVREKINRVLMERRRRAGGAQLPRFFSAYFPNFTIPCMISDSEPKVLLGLKPYLM